jgi:hypothetical protein
MVRGALHLCPAAVQYAPVIVSQDLVDTWPLPVLRCSVTIPALATALMEVSASQHVVSPPVCGRTVALPLHELPGVLSPAIPGAYRGR